MRVRYGKLNGISHLRTHDSLVKEVLGQALDDLNLLLDCQACDGILNHASDRGLVLGDEALIIHEGEEAHDELAVHAVGDAAVAGDAVAKVLDLEGSLEAGGEEAAEGGDERGEGGEDHDVELHGRDPEGVGDVGPSGEVIGVGGEDGVGGAFQPGPEVGAEVVDRADEVLVAHEDVGHKEAEDDGADPGADEAFDSLFGGELDQLGAAEGDAADVGEDVVGDDEADGEEEPDHALEDVVHDEVGLHHDQVEGHVGPAELGELESVVAFLEGADEEDKAHDVEHEADEAVVCCKGKEDLVDQDNVFEIIDDAFAIEKVHCRCEEVPVQRLGQGKILVSGGHGRDCNDFFE